MATEYPKRPSFFAYRFCRLMAKVCLANEVGPNVCWLLTTIAMTEDAKGYRDAVTYYNEQLMAVTGFNSVESLNCARKKAIAAGWLNYIPGAKGKAGRYWVLTPDRFRTFDDAPSDERPDKYFRDLPPLNSGSIQDGEEILPGNSGRIREESAEESGRNQRKNPGGISGRIREESAEHSSLTPNTPPLTLSLPQEANGVGVVIDLEPFDELIRAWKAAALPGHEQVQRTSTRVGWWQQRLAVDDWRDRWREAIERAGRSARLCGRTVGWSSGLRIDTFLKTGDWVQRILEGEFDDAPPAAAGATKMSDGERLIAEAMRKRGMAS